MKVNCFPERVGIYDTCDGRRGNQSEEGHGYNEHTAEPIYLQKEPDRTMRSNNGRPGQHPVWTGDRGRGTGGGQPPLFRAVCV